MYKHQLRHGRHFLHEHPWSASSWRLFCIDELVKDERVYVVRSDLCRFGMSTVNSEGEKMAAKKRTGFMTSSVRVAEELEGEQNKDTNRLQRLE